MGDFLVIQHLGREEGGKKLVQFFWRGVEEFDMGLNRLEAFKALVLPLGEHADDLQQTFERYVHESTRQAKAVMVRTAPMKIPTSKTVSMTTL